MTKLFPKQPSTGLLSPPAQGLCNESLPQSSLRRTLLSAPAQRLYDESIPWAALNTAAMRYS